MVSDELTSVVPLWDELPVCESTCVATTLPGSIAFASISCDVFGQTVTFDLQEVPSQPVPFVCNAVLEIGALRGLAHVDADWLDHACQRAGICRSPQVPWSGVATQVRAFLFFWAFNGLLSRLKALLGRSVVPVATEVSVIHDAPLRRVAFKPRECAGISRAWLYLDLPEEILRRLPRESAPESLWMRLPMLATLQAGWQMLTMHLMASLRCGDVVLLRRPLQGLRMSVEQRLLADVSEQDNDYVIASTWYMDEMREMPMDEVNTDVDLSQSVMLDQLSVPLVCEVGRIAVSVADLKAFRPGSVLPLSRRADQAVDLIVNGQRIGQGELVRLDGLLGVRVTSLADSNG